MMIVEEKDVRYTGTEGIPHAAENDSIAEGRKTGDWRVFKPVMCHAECIACDLCWISCPDSAISLNAEGKPVVNYELCKGCLICEQVCPKKGKAITRVRDTHEG